MYVKIAIVSISRVVSLSWNEWRSFWLVEALNVLVSLSGGMLGDYDTNGTVRRKVRLIGSGSRARERINVFA